MSEQPTIKYIQVYDINHDEVYQIKIPSEMETPPNVERISIGQPIPYILIRPRSIALANEERAQGKITRFCAKNKTFCHCAEPLCATQHPETMMPNPTPRSTHP